MTGLSAEPEGGTRVWFGSTSATTPSQVHELDARTGRAALRGPTPPGAVRLAARGGDRRTRRRRSTARPCATRCCRPPARPTAPRSDGALRLRRLRRRAHPRLEPLGARLGRGRRRLGRREPARRQRGGRGLAPRRHAGAQAVGLRRLRRRGRRARRRRLDDARAARRLRRQQRRPARRRGAHPAAAGVRRRGLQRAAARHGALRAVRARPHLERRVRHRRRPARSWAGCSATRPTTGSPTGRAYPAVLFTVFDGDSRVDPLHARKLCAALQAATTSPAPVLLRAEAEVGHGARSVRRTLGLSVDVLAFLAAHTGLALARRLSVLPRTTSSRGAGPTRAAERLWRVVEGIGGERRLGRRRLRVWALRGRLDRLVGGPGPAPRPARPRPPGRRRPARHLAGAARLTRAAAAAALGDAAAGRRRARARGRARPRRRHGPRRSGRRSRRAALAGHAYWWAVAPLHGPVFAGMLARTSPAPPRRRQPADRAPPS